MIYHDLKYFKIEERFQENNKEFVVVIRDNITNKFLKINIQFNCKDLMKNNGLYEKLLYAFGVNDKRRLYFYLSEFLNELANYKHIDVYENNFLYPHKYEKLRMSMNKLGSIKSILNQK